jgi:GTP1/Obg family GTP-binding protein
LADIRRSYQQEQEHIEKVKKEVDSQIAELKTSDPKLDENALFLHANKYGFRDLKQAYSNMNDMKKALVDVEQRTVKNLKTRETEPISTGPVGEMSETTGYDPNEMSRFEGAAEYLDFIKGKSKK